MKYIIGNWKMNKTAPESIDFMRKLSSFLMEDTYDFNCHVVIAPPVIHLPHCFQFSKEINLAAQNLAAEDFGAYTGEISAAMLSEYVKYAIIGHSERRQYFQETAVILNKKITMAFKYNIRPVFCVGEKEQDREFGNYFNVIEGQLNETIMLLPDELLSNCIIAYEPVWAIGTGKTPSLAQIEEMHTYIRKMLVSKIGKYNASKMPILYGGSCSVKNSSSILHQNNVDGLLVGGASLDFMHFKQIIECSDTSC